MCCLPHTLSAGKRSQESRQPAARQSAESVFSDGCLLSCRARAGNDQCITNALLPVYVLSHTCCCCVQIYCVGRGAGDHRDGMLLPQRPTTYSKHPCGNGVSGNHLVGHGAGTQTSCWQHRCHNKQQELRQQTKTGEHKRTLLTEVQK